MPIVFRGRVFSVEVEHTRFPDGREHEITLVRHPPSVVLIPLLDDGRIMLIRQYRPSMGRYLWELPAGSLEAGEIAEAAAVRECEEEIGLVPQRIERLTGLFPTPGYCDEEFIFFRLSNLRPPSADSSVERDEDEDIEARAFTIAEARAMVGRGEVVDLKTAYGLTLV